GVNRYSVDRRAVEAMARGGTSSPAPSSPVVAATSTLATALLPLVLIVWGLRRRQTLVLDLGIVFAALSLVTLRYYVHIAPLWALLTAAGATLVLGSLRVGRFLRDAPGGERRGFTSRPLFRARSRGLETAAVAAVFAPEARPAPAAEPGGFTPGGGRYGGGGATGDF